MYRTIVSWLAFVACASIGVSIGWGVVHDFFASIRDVLKGGRFSLDFRLSMPEMVASLAMGVLALAIIAPWIQRLATKLRWLRVDHWFSASTAEKFNIGGRWLLAIGLVLLTAPFNFLAIPSAFLIGPEISQLFSLGPSAFIDAVFFPGGREAKPPYTVKLARFYVKQMRWEDAEEEYARMLSFYPDSLEAWEERLALAFKRGADADPEPRRILALAIKALKRPEDQDAIHRRFTRGA